MCASPPSEAVQVNTGNYGVFQKALTNTEDGLAIEPRRNPSRTMHLGAPLFNQAKSNSKSMSYLHYIHTILSNTPSRVHSTDIHEITTFEFFLWSDVEPKPNFDYVKKRRSRMLSMWQLQTSDSKTAGGLKLEYKCTRQTSRCILNDTRSCMWLNGGLQIPHSARSR